MRSYQSIPSERGLNASSRASDEFPLLVNCAGDLSSVFPFTTHNTVGRADYYFLYLVQGELEVALPDGERTVGAGTVLIFPPTYAYRYSCQAKAPLQYLWAHFTGSYAARLLEECGFSPLPYCEIVGEGRLITDAFYKLLSACETESPWLRQELGCAMEHLILSTAHAIIKPRRRPLEKSISYIHGAFQENIRIPDLAAMEHLSHSRYIALFRQQMGTSPTAYLIGLRMERACELLLNTDMSVKQIGISVGYDDPQFFSKLFKKHVGLSPVQYRRNQ